MAQVNQGRTSNRSKLLFHWLRKGNSLKNSSTYGVRTRQVGAGSGSQDCIIGGGGRGGSGDSDHNGSDIVSNYICGCSEVSMEMGCGGCCEHQWGKQTYYRPAKG